MGLNKSAKTTKFAFLIMGIIFLVYLSALFIVAEEGKEIGDITNSPDAKQVTDVLTMNGITGMKIINYSVNEIPIDKTDYQSADFNLSTSFDFILSKLYNGDRGLTQEIYIINNKATRESFNFSTIVQIDYPEVTWNGSLIKLGVYDKLHPFTFRTNNGSAPNIFFDTKYNKRINYQDVAEQGGYAIGYSDKGVSYIEMIIKDKKIDALSISKIDPTYYNQTNGFSLGPCTSSSQPYGITNNGSAFFVVSYNQGKVCIFNNSGTIRASFTVPAVPFAQPSGITTNGTSLYVISWSNARAWEFNLIGSNLNNISIYGKGSAGSLAVIPSTLGVPPTGFYYGEYSSTKKIYITNLTGGNNNSFNTPNNVYGIASNNSDIWTCDGGSNLTHFNMSANLTGSLADSSSLSSFGISQCYGIYTNSTDGGSPTDFWITDYNDYFVYHLGLTDNSAPVLNIISPQNRTITSNTLLDINFSVGDENPLSFCWYSNDSGINNNSLTGCSGVNGTTYINITGVTWIDGINNVTIYANDSSNNIASKSITFYISTGDIIDCGVLTDANVVYTLTQNISSSGTCLNITANNVTIIGAGYSINFSSDGTTGYGVYSYKTNFTNIQGLTVYEGSTISNNSHGIYLNYAHNSTLYNNTVYAIGGTSDAIKYTTSIQGNISYNTGIAVTGKGINLDVTGNVTGNYGVSNSSTGFQFYPSYAGNSLLIDNSGGSNTKYGWYIRPSGTSAYTFINDTGQSNSSNGMYIFTIYNMVMINSTAISNSTSQAMYIYQFAQNNTFINQIAISNNPATAGIYFFLAYNMTVQDCVNVTGVGGGPPTGYFVHLLNCSFNTSLYPPGTKNFIRQWYYKAYVNDTAGNPIENANVTAMNLTGRFVSNYTTGADGYTPLSIITEYIASTNSSYLLRATNTTDHYSHLYPFNKNGFDNNIYNDTFTITNNLIYDCGYTDFFTEQTFFLMNNLSSTGTCLDITANNITLIGNGYSINYSYGSVGNGINTNFNFTNIKGINFIDGNQSTATEYGIYSTSHNNTIFNNTFSIISNSSYGIYLKGNGNNLSNNIITLSSIDHLISSSYGIYLFRGNNSILMNNVFTSFSTVEALYSYGSNNNILIDNLVFGRSSGNGITLGTTSNNNTLINNVGTSNSSTGIYIGGNKNNLTSNTGIVNGSPTGSYAYGIYVTGNDNFLMNNTGIAVGSTCNVYSYRQSGGMGLAGNNNSLKYNFWHNNVSGCTGFVISTSNNNSIIGDIITTNNTAPGVGFGGSPTNNTFIGCNISTGTGKAISVLTFISTNYNNVFLNCSYNSSLEYTLNQGVNGKALQIIRKWYYSAYVNDTAGNPIENANVTAFNVTGDYMFNLTTDVLGFTPITTIIEYINNDSIKTYYSNYNIKANNVTDLDSHYLNVTLNNNTLNDGFTISYVDTLFPTFVSYLDNNGTQIGDNGISYFNVTVLDTNGTVILTFNNTNYSASTGGGGIYNVTIEHIQNGTYSYNWSAYGSGGLNNYNISNTRDYTILNDLTPPFISITQSGDTGDYVWATNTSNKYKYNFTNSHSYANGTWAKQDFMYIEVNVQDYSNLSSVWVEWKNETGWFNFTMNSIDTQNYSYNMTNQPEWFGYTFNVWANDSYGKVGKEIWRYNYYNTSALFELNGADIGWWTWPGPEETYRKVVGLSSNGNETIDYRPLYFYRASPDFVSGYPFYTGYLGQEQGTGTTSTDTGYLLFTRPNTTQDVWCGVWAGASIGEPQLRINNTNITNMYVHVWWGSSGGTATHVYKLNRGIEKGFRSNYLGYPEGTEYNYTINISDPTTAREWIDTTGLGLKFNNYSLDVSYLVTNFSVTATDINTLAFYQVVSPSTINTLNYSSYIILNLPDNTTLQGLDTDGDGLNDWNELYFNLTDPWINNTDGDGCYDGNDTNPLIPSANCELDTEYPQFTSYWDNNGTQTKIGTGYFNVTVTSTNGTVILNFNNTNYTASNWSNPTVFNVTIGNLMNRTYYYNWTSWGNGTSNLYNVSNNRAYTILDDITSPSFVNSTPNNQTIGYGDSFNYYINASDNVAVGCFALNDTHFTINCTGYMTNNSLLSGGVYWINVSVNDSSNNLNSTIMFVNVTPLTGLIYTYINNLRTDATINLDNYAWLNATLVNGLGNILIYSNNTIIHNGTAPLGNYTLFNEIGLFNVTSLYEGNENYTSDYETWWVSVLAPVVTGGAHSSGSALRQFECYNFTGGKCVLIGTYLTCPEGLTNLADCNKLKVNKTCGDGICSDDETFYNCPSDCKLPNIFEEIGTIISPRNPTIGIIFIVALVILLIFFIWSKIPKGD